MQTKPIVQMAAHMVLPHELSPLVTSAAVSAQMHARLQEPLLTSQNGLASAMASKHSKPTFEHDAAEQRTVAHLPQLSTALPDTCRFARRWRVRWYRPEQCSRAIVLRPLQRQTVAPPIHSSRVPKPTLNS